MRRLAASPRPAAPARRSAGPSPGYRRRRIALAPPALRGTHPFSPGLGSRPCVPPPPLSPPAAPKFLLRGKPDESRRRREDARPPDGIDLLQYAVREPDYRCGL